MPLPFPARRGAVLLVGAALLLAPSAWPCGAAEADGAPSPPAEAPPAPALVSPDSPRAGRAGDAAAFESLAEGRWRIRFASGREELSEAAAHRVEELGRRLAGAAGTGRVTVEAQASGPEADVSAARRLSLGRALAVKAALASGGLAPTRIDLRPLGRTPEAADAADILPPPARPAGGK